MSFEDNLQRLRAKYGEITTFLKSRLLLSKRLRASLEGPVQGRPELLAGLRH